MRHVWVFTFVSGGACMGVLWEMGEGTTRWLLFASVLLLLLLILVSLSVLKEGVDPPTQREE